MAILPNFLSTVSNMFKPPATLPFPLEPRPVPQGTRGHIEVEMDKCILCGICQKKCPTGAIDVSKPETKWGIRRMQCIQCGACVESCPKKCLLFNTEQTAPNAKHTYDSFVKAAEPAEKDAVKENA